MNKPTTKNISKTKQINLAKYLLVKIDWRNFMLTTNEDYDSHNPLLFYNPYIYAAGCLPARELRSWLFDAVAPGSSFLPDPKTTTI